MRVITPHRVQDQALVRVRDLAFPHAAAVREVEFHGHGARAGAEAGLVRVDLQVDTFVGLNADGEGVGSGGGQKSQ